MLSPRLWNKSLFFALASPAAERTRAGQASAPKLVRVVLLRLPGRVKLGQGRSSRQWRVVPLASLIVLVVVVDLEPRSAPAAGTRTPADQGALSECRGKSTPGT